MTKPKFKIGDRVTGLNSDPKDSAAWIGRIEAIDKQGYLLLRGERMLSDGIVLGWCPPDDFKVVR